MADRNALLGRESELRARLDVGWQYVQPGGIRAYDERYLRRFLELLAEYESVRDQLRATEPPAGELEVLVWPDCGDWIFERAWQRGSG